MSGYPTPKQSNKHMHGVTKVNSGETINGRGGGRSNYVGCKSTKGRACCTPSKYSRGGKV